MPCTRMRRSCAPAPTRSSRPDRAFAAMPKLRVEVGPLHHAAFDQETPLPPERVAVDRRGRGVVVRVLLAGLGDPDRVLVGARTTLADVPLAGLPWRIVALGDAEGFDGAPPAR